MCSLVINWLSEKVPEFGVLPVEHKQVIQDFVILWTFFEATVLQNNANMGRIREFAGSVSQDALETVDIEETAAYFRARYFEDGAFTRHYGFLNLERSGNPREVDRMLLNRSETDKDKLVGCLGIIYRYRNNLFHGAKWDYALQQQHLNFAQSNALLIRLMDNRIRR